MLLKSWNRLRSCLYPYSRRRGADWRCRPEVESLEERRVLTSLLILSTSNQLLAVDSSAPGTIQSALPITGLPAGESIMGIDFRPSTGQLYGLGSSNHLYVISAAGAATPVSADPFAVSLNGTAFGFNFDPVADDIRVISDTGQNMRINPDTGAVVDGDPNTPGTQPDAPLNPPGHVVAVAYMNKTAGATFTTLYGIDATSDMFAQIGGQNGSPSPNLGAVTPVAPLGGDTSDQVGFDIGSDNTGFAAITVNGTSELINVNLSTGPSAVGPIGNGTVPIRGLAIVLAPPGSSSPLPPMSPPPSVDPLFAVTNTNNLLTFISNAPGTIKSTTPITGLQPGESVLGVDVRPATGQLYALGSTSRLYTINPSTGVATQVGTGTFAVPLNGVSFGFSFDPVIDLIRVVSDTDQNMRINPNAGTVVDTDPSVSGTQPDAFLNETYTVGAAYTNNVTGASTTTLYGVDGLNNRLVRIGGPNGSPSPNQGQVTAVGALGATIDWARVPAAPFAITPGGTPYVALLVGGHSLLYSVDLNTGHATAIGEIGAGTTKISGLTAITSLVQPPPTDPPPSGSGPAPIGSDPPAATHIIATGTDNGGGPEVKVFAANGTVLYDFFAYDPHFGGGVRVAVGDVNGDGYPDLITAPGPGGGPNIKVFNGKDASLIYSGFAGYSPSFTGGCYVAAGDVNGDGRDDVIVGAGAGGGPNVTVFSPSDGSVPLNFFAYSPMFTGGVRVAAGDVDGDGKAEIITGPGAGGGPEVTVFKDSASGLMVVQNYFAYSPSFSGGIYVGAGDLNGDDAADVVVGAGAGGGPNITAFNGLNGVPLASFFAYDAAFSGGVRVAAVDLNGDGKADFLAAPGPGAGPAIEAFDGVTDALLDQFYAYNPSFGGGVFIAGG